MDREVRDGENPGHLWFLGRPDQALDRAKHAVSLAEGAAYAYGRAAAWSQFAFLHQLRRDEKATRLWAQRTIALGTEQGFPYREAVGKTFHGWAIAQSGQIERGIVELKEGIEGCRAAGAELDGPFYLALLAEAYILAHDRRKAAATLRDAIERIEGTHSFFYEAELWRLQGQLHWALASDRTAAADCFRRAIKVAQSQGARSLELRAAVSMARLLRERKAYNRGAELLAPVYRSFAGVAETADLHSARLEIEALKANAPGAGKWAV